MLATLLRGEIGFSTRGRSRLDHNTPLVLTADQLLSVQFSVQRPALDHVIYLQLLVQRNDVRLFCKRRKTATATLRQVDTPRMTLGSGITPIDTLRAPRFPAETRRRATKAGVILSLVCCGLAAAPASAADAVSPLTPEMQTTTTEAGWTFAASPYFWAAGLSGDTSQFGLPVVHLDSSFSDILDELDFAAMVIGEARYERYSVFGDLIYSKISSGSGTPRGIVAGSVDVSSETFAGLLGAGYSVLDGADGHLDVVGGVRLWSVDTDISFSGGVLDGVSVSDGATWVDGLVGIRGNYSFTPEIYFTGWGLVGAGGADLDWDVAAALGYRFNDRFSMVAGYRALGVDYNDDGFLFDVVQQGPIFGLVVRF